MREFGYERIAILDANGAEVAEVVRRRDAEAIVALASGAVAPIPEDDVADIIIDYCDVDRDFAKRAAGAIVQELGRRAPIPEDEETVERVVTAMMDAAEAGVTLYADVWRSLARAAIRAINEKLGGRK